VSAPPPAALEKADATSRALAERWCDAPEHHRIVDAFAGVDTADVEAVAAAAEALFADTDSWLAPLLAPLMAALMADPWVQPPLRVARDPLRTGAQLYDCAAGTLTATVHDGTALATTPLPDTLVCSGRMLVVRYVRAAGWHLDRWRIHDDRLKPITPEPLTDDTVLRLDGRTDAHRLAPAGSTPSRQVVTLTFAVRAAANAREYHRVSGRLIRLGAASDVTSRTRMLLTFLRLSGRSDAAACFDAATRDPAFELRWAAMREWLALDARCAAPRLSAMVDDPHPEVRAAARATLPLVEAQLCRA
jgi:hypothetical protein